MVASGKIQHIGHLAYLLRPLRCERRALETGCTLRPISAQPHLQGERPPEIVGLRPIPKKALVIVPEHALVEISSGSCLRTGDQGRHRVPCSLFEAEIK